MTRIAGFPDSLVSDYRFPGYPNICSTNDHPHIFEPFYSTKEEGTGLGLSIVYNIVKEHQGIIKVDSKKEEGVRFIVELPITND